MSRKDNCINQLFNSLAESYKKNNKSFDPDALLKDLKKSVDSMDNLLNEHKIDSDYLYKKLVEEKQEQVLKAQHQHIATLNKYAENVKFAEDWKNAGEGRTAAEALEAKLVGGERPIKGSKISVASDGMAFFREDSTKFLSDLEANNLFRTFKKADKELQLNIAKELFEIDYKNGKAKNITGDKSAGRIAELMHESGIKGVDRMNKHGAFIGKLKHYIVKQSHSRDKIIGKLRGSIEQKNKMKLENKEQWKVDILDKLNIFETFKTMNKVEIDNILNNIFTKIDSGKYYSEELTTLAGRVSKERHFIFKSAEDWFSYNEKYGKGDMFKMFIDSLRLGARNSALMKHLGPHPDAVFNKLIKKMEKDMVNDPYLKEDMSRIDLKNYLKEVSGESNYIQNGRMAFVGSSLRAQQTVSKLGAVVLTSFGDVPIFHAMAKQQGLPFFARVGASFETALSVLNSSAERKELGRQLGVGIEGMLGDFNARFVSQDEIGGNIAKGMDLFFKLSGLQRWTDSWKVGATMMMSTRIAHLADRTWDQLLKNPGDKKLTETLKKYNIGEKEWNVIRKSEPRTHDGNKYIIPENVRELNEDVADNLLGYFTDNAEMMVPTPGARERVKMNTVFGLLENAPQPGTVAGEAIRMFMQFKSFPVTIITRIGKSMALHNQASGRGITKQGIKNLSSIIPTMIAMSGAGYVATMAHDVAYGRSPRGMNRWGNWFNGDFNEQDYNIFKTAVMRGGGFGIFGDILLNLDSGYGAPPLSGVLGPTYDLGARLSIIASKLGDFDSYDKRLGEMVMLAKSNTPGINLFWGRWALNYLMVYSFQELTNPGYLNRLEANYRKFSAGEYMFADDGIPHLELFGE